MHYRTRKTLQIAALVVLVAVVESSTGGLLTASLITGFLRGLRHREKSTTSTIQDYNALTEENFRTMLSRLKQSGFVQQEERGVWLVTTRGRKIAARAIEHKRQHNNFLKRYSYKRNTIITFDIPKHADNKRDLLRDELRDLHYTLLHKSVWIGGSPLPKNFIDFLKEHRLSTYVHIFTIDQKGTITM